jgi:hypothetical protein
VTGGAALPPRPPVVFPAGRQGELASRPGPQASTLDSARDVKSARHRLVPGATQGRDTVEGPVMGGWSRARPHFRSHTETRFPGPFHAFPENSMSAGRGQTTTCQPARGERHVCLLPVTGTATSLNPVSGPFLGTHPARYLLFAANSHQPVQECRWDLRSTSRAPVTGLACIWAVVGSGSTWRIVKASWRYLAIFG